ncbi:MAG: tetratricopeptide repeat protein [Desulfobulbaceae bacterium]|uniref:Tetratricopeptide repeat protein n=1 Tax=Candidatus Desulfobia pelagia TaxID=2841692 RepID=A0A8J6TGZ9_9BACT|nr:tetratricopeptide repeat protein [Candidatus Desulfobia pelagia]
MGPFDWQEKKIEVGDFDLLNGEFAHIVQCSLPCMAVHFAGPATDAALPPAWKAGVEMVRHEQKGVWDSTEKDTLYLPLWAADDLAGVAVLEGCSEDMQGFSAVQLYEKSQQISREMRLLKQSFLDSVTGLLNGKALVSRLRRLQGEVVSEERKAVFSLLLVELYPRASDARKALESFKKAAAFLASLVGHLATPCHLGSSIFGLIWEGVDEKEALRTADLLLRWLKRENFPRGHIGITASDIEPPEADRGELFFEQAWKALEVARKRSPFALCSYRFVSNSCAHPLNPVADAVKAGLKKLWGKSDAFGLVQLHVDKDELGERSEAAWSADVGENPSFAIEGGDRLIFLEGKKKEEVLAWCSEVSQALSEKGVAVSMGVALYPCKAVRKSDMSGNCQRAMLHTAFYGPGSITVFDAVSLNISGDVYYNEGDLASAVGEYRRGLLFDPDNVNVMNSLGVTYANMSRYAEAVTQFEEVLAREEKNFMALYNLGFACLAMSDREKGLHYLERAHQAGDGNFDLFFQLGKLYCQNGRYLEALNVLKLGEKLGPKTASDVSHGAVYRYLGEAYRGVGEKEKAMTSLQRAVRYNPGDGTALSMLGEVYGEAKEGDEIALSLCRQSVELDSGQGDNWLRLGNVLMQQGDLEGAMSSFEKGLECDKDNARIFFSLGKVNEKMGKSAVAVKMFRGALKLEPKYKDALSALKGVKVA